MVGRFAAPREDLAMSERDPAPASSGDEPDRLDDTDEAELMRKVLRAQERHREGGVEPELGPAGAGAAAGDDGDEGASGPRT